MKFIKESLIFLLVMGAVNITSIFAAVPAGWQLTYLNDEGSGLAAVGNSEDRNSYRGIYWTGPDKSLTGVEIQLDWRGNIDAVDYEVTVWDVDETNDLEMNQRLMRSESVSGTDIIDGWNCFTFPSDVVLTTGKTIVVLSRTDPETLDGSNYIRVRNGYDESDEESSQWNIHYGSNQKMAGRRPGDEDQPEYFTFNIRLYGSDTTIPAADQYPNIPEDIQTTALSHESINISWTERGENNVPISHYNVYEYKVINDTTITETLIGSSVNTSFVHNELAPESDHIYVIRAVTDSGNEGYHSLKNDTNWAATTLSQAGQQATEIPDVPGITSLTIINSNVIRINWAHTSETVNEENGFILERKTGGSPFAEINTAGQNSTSFNDNNLSPGTEYDYRIKAFNAIGESAYSSTISGRTTDPGMETVDINHDGVLNILDVIHCVNAINNNSDADVNNDGTTNSSDLDAIISDISGI